MTAPERIFAWSKETTDRDNRPVTETGWEDDDYDAKWYADRGTPLSSYTRTDLIQPMIDKAVAEANARADRADAALAAQIEADAGIADALYRMALKDSDDDLSSPWKSHKASAYGTAAQAIRNQPHDRTALDRMLAEARANALREAAEMVRGTAYTSSNVGRRLEPVSPAMAGMDMHHATIADAILALIENPDGQP